MLILAIHKIGNKCISAKWEKFCKVKNKPVHHFYHYYYHYYYLRIFIGIFNILIINNDYQKARSQYSIYLSAKLLYFQNNSYTLNKQNSGDISNTDFNHILLQISFTDYTHVR